MNQVKTKYFSNGHVCETWEVPRSWIMAIESRDWPSLDKLAEESLLPEGALHRQISKFCPIKKVEHLISLRSSPDEAGIWHDDGSRDLAFSLSLSLRPFKGAGLSLRKKNRQDTAISLGPRGFGVLTCFLTGSNGYEHKTEEVLEGERLVLAGWIN